MYSDCFLLVNTEGGSGKELGSDELQLFGKMNCYDNSSLMIKMEYEDNTNGLRQIGIHQTHQLQFP